MKLRTRELRQALGLTLKEVAEGTGVQPDYLSRLERQWRGWVGLKLALNWRAYMELQIQDAALRGIHVPPGALPTLRELSELPVFDHNVAKSERDRRKRRMRRRAAHARAAKQKAAEEAANEPEINLQPWERPA